MSGGSIPPRGTTNNNETMNRIEELIGETILQDSKPIEIAGLGTLQVAHPSVATLIEASKIISRLPVMPSIRGKEETALVFTLAHARDCAILGDVAAVLLLGKKGISRRVDNRSRTKSWKNNRLFDFFHRKVFLRTLLAQALLEECTPEQLQNIIVECLGLQQVGFFLNIITTLNEANVLRQTRNVTTVSGQSSTAPPKTSV